MIGWHLPSRVVLECWSLLIMTFWNKLLIGNKFSKYSHVIDSSRVFSLIARWNKCFSLIYRPYISGTDQSTRRGRDPGLGSQVKISHPPAESFILHKRVFVTIASKAFIAKLWNLINGKHNCWCHKRYVQWLLRTLNTCTKNKEHWS